MKSDKVPWEFTRVPAARKVSGNKQKSLQYILQMPVGVSLNGKAQIFHSLSPTMGGQLKRAGYCRILAGS